MTMIEYNELSPTLLLLPLSGWSLAYLYCYKTGGKEAFSRNVIVHDCHSVGVVLLALLCLIVDDETLVSERLPVSFSGAYFVVELFDCLLRRDAVYVAHAVLSMAMTYGVVSDPRLRLLRLASRGFLMELSNVALHRWHETRTKRHFGLFVVLFTGCRIVWLPILARKMFDAVGYDTIVFPALALFYLLNVAWYAKMVVMLMNYKEKPGVAGSPDDRKTKAQ